MSFDIRPGEKFHELLFPFEGDHPIRVATIKGSDYDDRLAGLPTHLAFKSIQSRIVTTDEILSLAAGLRQLALIGITGRGLSEFQQVDTSLNSSWQFSFPDYPSASPATLVTGSLHAYISRNDSQVKVHQGNLSNYFRSEISALPFDAVLNFASAMEAFVTRRSNDG